MNICTIIGVRPQFIKAAVLSPIIRKEHKEFLIHTGQHYDANMSDVFFRELSLPKPDYALAPAIGKDQERIDNMVRQLIPIIQREKADAVLIYGDTNSTLAGALAADQLKIPVIHVEAGERNGLIKNPEEQITGLLSAGNGKFAKRRIGGQVTLYWQPDGSFVCEK